MLVWSTFKHQNILEFVGYHLSENLEIAYLVAPYVSNGNVRDYLEKNSAKLEERLGLVGPSGAVQSP